MAGIAREYPEPGRIVQEWLDAAAQSGMPVDARLWRDRGLSGSHPACMGVVAAREQGLAASFLVLRALREAIFVERRKVDSAEAILAAATDVGGGSAGGGGPGDFSLERFRVDLTSTATIENFGADLAEAAAIREANPLSGSQAPGTGAPGTGPAALPVLRISDREPIALTAISYDELRSAAIEAGAEPQSTPAGSDLPALLDDRVVAPSGRLATAEFMKLVARPRPVVEAELWRLAFEWQLKPYSTGLATLWQRA